MLDALLVKYADEGVLNLDDVNVLRIPPLSSLGTTVELIMSSQLNASPILGTRRSSFLLDLPT